MRTVIVINNDQMGGGDAALGRTILANCLRKLPRFAGLEAIVLYNAGVRLAVEGSPVATELRLLQDRGIEILACGTCVDYYKLGDRMLVDKVSNMDAILATLQSADKVVTL